MDVHLNKNSIFCNIIGIFWDAFCGLSILTIKFGIILKDSELEFILNNFKILSKL